MSREGKLLLKAKEIDYCPPCTSAVRNTQQLGKRQGGGRKISGPPTYAESPLLLYYLPSRIWKSNLSSKGGMVKRETSYRDPLG